MSLLDRLRGFDDAGDFVEEKIPSHQFQAAMNEWAAGAAGFSRATIISGFVLTAADEPELDALKAIWDQADTNAKKLSIRKAFDNIVMLAESPGHGFYTTKAEINARLNDAVS